MRAELVLAAFGMAFVVVPSHADGMDARGAIEPRALPVVAAPLPANAAMAPLSPGNRLIAHALYNAQKANSAAGALHWSLERVSDARAEGRNWGEVFQQMKREGLLEAETLGQVVTWYQYHTVTPARVAQYPNISVVKVLSQPGSAN